MANPEMQAILKYETPGPAQDCASNRSKPKSRSGCITCKQRRLKCDEVKPSCSNCEKRKLKCGGYATRFKWKAFGDRKGKDQKETVPAGPDVQAGGRKKRALSVAFGENEAFTEMRPSASTKSESSTMTEADSVFEKPGNVKLEELKSAPKSPEGLSLKQHLELTSMSILGKSTRDLETENDRMTHPEPAHTKAGFGNAKSMRRSYSTVEVPTFAPAQGLHRSLSSADHRSSVDLAGFRKEFQEMTGLHSLAEAATSDKFQKMPETAVDFVHSDASPISPFFADDKVDPKIETPGKQKEWQNQLVLHSPVTQLSIPSPAVKDAISDLNLTPSLSALFSYVFTNPEHARGDPFLQNMQESIEEAPSPLNLVDHVAPNTPQATDPSTAVSVYKNEARDQTNQANGERLCPLLTNVSELLIRQVSNLPSINRSPSAESLLVTSEHQQILYLYSTYTCGIMSIKTGVAENPWSDIYLPLADKYSYLFNSIASMTLYHLAGNAKLRENSLNLRSKGYFYMKKCILELATGLSRLENAEMSDNQLPADVALATCLNLAVTESWDTHTSSGIAHLKGAKSMIQKVISIISECSTKRRNSQVQSSSHREKLALATDEDWKKMEESVTDGQGNLGPLNGLFIPKKIQLLFNEWIYFEVLSQMTSSSGYDDKGIDLVATITKAIQINQKARDGALREHMSAENEDSPQGSSHSGSFFENLDHMLQNSDFVDPLLGCAQSLFSIMGKVANLICKVRKSREADKRQARNTLSNITSASELKQQLMDWKPNVSASVAAMMNGEKDSSWDLYSCVSTAEAYRYATLLYLHEAVPEVPSSPSHQLAEKIFVLLASIPSTSNLYTIHIYPLLVSSCEAEPGEERDWCEARWGLLIERLWIGNIDRAFEVVKEVWRRKDEYNRQFNREAGDHRDDLDLDDPRNISAHLQDVAVAMRRKPSNDERGITSRLHWSSVMREWGWEVLLA